MTDVDLLQTVTGEIAAMKLKKPDGTVWKDYAVYMQNKPYKTDETIPETDEPEEQDDYILTVLGDEETDDDGRWKVEIQVIFQIMSFDDRRQGDLILASLMNQIDLHFVRKGILAGKYELEPKRSKNFNDLCAPNYYQAAYITHWKIPNVPVQMEVDQFI